MEEGRERETPSPFPQSNLPFHSKMPLEQLRTSKFKVPIFSQCFLLFLFDEAGPSCVLRRSRYMLMAPLLGHAMCVCKPLSLSPLVVSQFLKSSGGKLLHLGRTLDRQSPNCNAKLAQTKEKRTERGEILGKRRIRG